MQEAIYTREVIQDPDHAAMDISVIIVNWNSIAYLEDCVASIRQQADGVKLEIIVVDNCSPAGDAELLDGRFPSEKVIKSPKNLGFAGANNLGFTQSTGKHILFLNPDTKVEGRALRRMLESIRSLADAGVLGCKLLNTDRSIQTSCVQTFPTILNQLLDSDWLRGVWPNSRLWGTKALFSSSSEATKVEVISGACMLIDRDVFERIGRFSEEYFMYAEDLDLCYKAHRAGYTNYYLGTATVIHHGGKSSNFESATQMKWKAVAQFCKKYRGPRYAFLFRIVMASAAVVRLAVIAILGLVRKIVSPSRPRSTSFAKWKLVLKAVLTPSA